MSDHYDIEMGLDDTLEIDTIIQNWNPPPNLVNTTYDTGNEPDYDLKGLDTKTTIFDPNKSGDYTININGQELSIKVRDSNDALPNSGDYLDWSNFEPTPPYTYSVRGSFESNLISTNYSSRTALEHIQDSDEKNDVTTSRTVDLTYATKMKFVSYVNTDGPYDQFIIEIGDDRVFSVASDIVGGHDWTQREIDVSEYSGEFKLSIGHSISGGRTREVTSRVTDFFFE